MRLVAVAQSDVGRKREVNEDTVLVDDEVGLLLVCDGMGGHSAGEVAARVATDTVHRTVRAAVAEIDGAADRPAGYFSLTGVLEQAISEASRAVYRRALDQPELAGMGCTATALLEVDGKAIVGHVGDSRLYLVRDGRAHRITRDHTVAQELVDLGQLDAKDADKSRASHSLTRAVGVQEAVQTDTLLFDLLPGDVGVLCTDGLSFYLDGPEELARLATAAAGEDLASRLVALANERGGGDNVTVITFMVHAESEDESALGAARARLDALSHSPLFSGLPLSRRQRALSYCEVRTFEPGTPVIAEGSRVDGLHILVDGLLSHASGETVEPLSGSGSQFGALSLLTEPKEVGRISALRRSELLFLSRRAFETLVKAKPRLGARLLRRLAERLADQARRFPGEPF